MKTKSRFLPPKTRKKGDIEVDGWCVVGVEGVTGSGV
jgi:hypothetical protein